MSDHNEKIIIEPSTTLPKEPIGKPSPEISEAITEEKDWYSNKAEKEISRMWYIVIGIVIFVVVSFLLDHYLLINDHIKDKDLYIKYSEMQNNYYQEIKELGKELGNKIHNQEIKIKDLENELEVLRARNSYLK